MSHQITTIDLMKEIVASDDHKQNIVIQMLTKLVGHLITKTEHLSKDLKMAQDDISKLKDQANATLTNANAVVTLLGGTITERDGLKTQVAALTQQVADLTASQNPSQQAGIDEVTSIEAQAASVLASVLPPAAS